MALTVMKILGENMFRQLFCSQDMQDAYDIDSQVKYEKQGDLKITKVEGGFIHPFISTDASGSNLTAGVTNKKSVFVPESSTTTVVRHTLPLAVSEWFEYPSMDPKTNSTKYIDEDVVFIGALSGHYGHFILEGLSRIWPFLCNDFIRLKAVYISENKNNKFLELFKFFGLNPDDLIEIDEVTQFRNILIPEPSIRLHDYYHLKYKDTIDKIKREIKPSSAKKVFFSKQLSRSGRAIGESYIQRVFFDNGYEVFYPEKMTLYETISVLKGCDEFVASSGTNFHNSIFLNDGVAGVCLNRSAHFHPIQTMINRMRCLNVSYIDVFIKSTPDSFGNAPCFVGVTKHLVRYFDFNSFSFSTRKFFWASVFRSLEYLWFKLYRAVYKLSRYILPK